MNQAQVLVFYFSFTLLSCFGDGFLVLVAETSRFGKKNGDGVHEAGVTIAIIVGFVLVGSIITAVIVFREEKKRPQKIKEESGAGGTATEVKPKIKSSKKKPSSNLRIKDDQKGAP